MLIQLAQNITSNGAYYHNLRFKENVIQLIVLEKGQRRPKINGNGLLDWEVWHIITSEEYFSERAALLQGRRRTPAKISDRLVVQVCYRKNYFFDWNDRNDNIIREDGYYILVTIFFRSILLRVHPYTPWRSRRGMCWILMALPDLPAMVPLEEVLDLQPTNIKPQMHRQPIEQCQVLVVDLPFSKHKVYNV